MAPDLDAAPRQPGLREPLIFRPERAPTGWRRFAGWIYNLWLVALVALVVTDDRGINWFTGIILALLVPALALGVYGATSRALGRRPSRYDERETVTLPADLVERVAELRARDERHDAFVLMRDETGLRMDDTVRALELVDEATGARPPKSGPKWPRRRAA